ncbi:MAG: ribonuclease III [Firmicutes bacterium]|jgi:ribonuclease-3|nr:ribonuclease III [Bacillota bacterium]
MAGQREGGSLRELKALLGVSFHDCSLLRKAITHSSFEGGGPAAGNERLEFLGDAVLKLTCAWYFYEKHPILAEGELSVIVGQVVSERSLASAAVRLGLSRFLMVSHSLEVTGGRELPSLLADAFEAIIGAVFLDQGLNVARDLIVDKLQLDAIDTRSCLKGMSFRNCKADLQELFQKRGKSLPQYRVVDEQGPDHDKTFMVSVYSGETAMGRGVGKTKKEAEQAAAEDALNHITFD